MIQLVPTYVKKLKQTKRVVRSVKVWSKEGVEALNGCFHCTDWSLFIEESDSLDEAVDVVSSYVNFCCETVLETKTFKTYPNSKPWINGETKRLIHDKVTAFKDKNTEEVKEIQKKIDKAINQAKKSFKDKLEDNFRGNKPKQLWEGIQTITGCKPKKKELNVEDEAKLANELNDFYTRFDCYDFSKEQSEVLEEIESLPCESVKVQDEEVRKLFGKVKPRSAPGPDEISGKTLKNCNESLAPVFSRLFEQSLVEGKVPDAWKTSTIVPVPKKTNPGQLND